MLGEAEEWREFGRLLECLSWSVLTGEEREIPETSE